VLSAVMAEDVAADVDAGEVVDTAEATTEAVAVVALLQ
jgi:hypothetical protein